VTCSVYTGLQSRRVDPDVESSDMVLDFKLSLDEDMQGGGYIKEHYVKREMQQKVRLLAWLLA
jgi:hypothetical protein